MQTTETVYKNRSNPNVVSFFEDNVAMDFSASTRLTLKLYNRNMVLQATVDTQDSPILLQTATDTTVSPNTTNQIQFDINTLVLDDGLYLAEVIVYDASHTSGQAVAHPQSPDDLLAFKFVVG
jgi:hypothetical protein